MKTIFILDNDQTLRNDLSKHLSSMGFKPVEFSSVVQMDEVTVKPFAIIFDHENMSAQNSLRDLKRLKRKMRGVAIIHMTKAASLKSESMKVGVYDFIEKNSAALVHLRTTLDRLKTQPSKTNWLTRLFGKKEKTPVLSPII